MSEVDSSLIHQGLWVDHQYGRVLGATITTKQNVSNVVIALLAIVVSIATTSLWNILMFATHQYRASSDPRDGLFRQQQILLRTMASPGTVFMDSVKMCKVWSLESSRGAVRCAIPALISLAFAAVSVAVGIFSSYIVSTNNLEVLVRSSACQDLNLTTYLSTQTSVFDLSLFASTSSFVDQCYASGPLPSQCEFYVRPRIQYSVDAAECPFSASVCHDPTMGVVLDSGLLDSNDAFGINTARKDRVQFRRKTTCSPVNVVDYMTIVNVSSYPEIPTAWGRAALPGEQAWLFNYGTDYRYRLPEKVTVPHSAISTQVTVEYDTVGFMAFGLEALADADAFVPIPSLQNNDSDTTLLFIFPNQVTSLTPINGPIYSSHTARVLRNSTVTTYGTDLPAGIIGCAPQYQFCVETDSGQITCTPLQGATPDGFEAQLPSANPMQLELLRLFGSASVLMTSLVVQSGTHSPFLNSTALVNDGEITGLPDDQWTIDAQKTEDLIWSYLKVFLAQHATGYATGGIDSPLLLNKPVTPSGQELCRNQKVVKPGGFANINVFGLVFTLAVALVLVTIDFGVLRLLILMSDAKTAASPHLKSWFEDGVYQIQRTAYEAYSRALWGQTDNEIPITAPHERLRNLAFYTSSHQDPYHPAAPTAHGPRQSEEKSCGTLPDSPSSTKKRPISLTRELRSPHDDDAAAAAHEQWSTTVPIPAPYHSPHTGHGF